MHNKKHYDMVALGELLIDFTVSGISEAGQRLFEQNPGGATANVLSAVSRYGLKTAFIGKVGHDMHGEYLTQTLNKMGIHTGGLVMTDDVFTTMAFVALEAGGERRFSFARKPGADTCLTWEEVDQSLLADTRIFHIGSLSLTDEPARTTTFKAIEYAKNAGALISYDPNYRASLWPDTNIASQMMRAVLPYVDIVKLSDEETELLTDQSSPEAASAALLAAGAQCVVVTLGKSGALVSSQNIYQFVEGYDIPAVDTTGAGDAFFGGFLYRILTSSKAISQCTADELLHFGRFANATATLCVQRHGGIPAMPTLAETDALMQRYSFC